MDVFIFEMAHFECYIFNMMETFIQPLLIKKPSSFLRIWLHWNNCTSMLTFNLQWKTKQNKTLSQIEFPVVLSLAVNPSTEWQGSFSLCLFSENNITKLNPSIKSHPAPDSNDTCQHRLKEKSHWRPKWGFFVCLFCLGFVLFFPQKEIFFLHKGKLLT